MKEEKKVIMIECPESGCEVKLPEDDLQGQIRHMNEKHSNSRIVEDRLRKLHGRY